MDKSTQTEGRYWLLRTGGARVGEWWGVTAVRHKISLWADDNIPKWMGWSLHNLVNILKTMDLYRAGPQIMSFCSPLFHIVWMRKNVNSWPKPLSMLTLHILPTSAWVFSGHPSFLPHPKDVHRRWSGMSKLPQSECLCVRLPLEHRKGAQRPGKYDKYTLRYWDIYADKLRYAIIIRTVFI